MASSFALQREFPPGDRKLTEPRVGKKFPRAPIIRFDRSRTMGLYDHLRTPILLVLTLYVIQGGYIRVEARNTNFSFLSFSSPDNFLQANDVQYFAFGKSFLLNSGAYSLGTNTSSCGRLYYKDKVRMKDDASGKVASFNTSFTFSITGLPSDKIYGDGFAFTFSRDTMISEERQGNNEGGGRLCLTKSDSTKFFAVEFDTYLNPEFNDTSVSHIGVDVDSLNSTSVHDLCEDAGCSKLVMINTGSYTAWIDYDGPSQKLAVYFSPGSIVGDRYVSKPSSGPVINEVLNLTEQLDADMYVGFSASIGNLKEVHQILGWQFAAYGLPERTNPPRERIVRIIAGVCAGVGAVLLLAVIAGVIVIAKRKRRASHTKRGTKFNLVDQNLVPRVFTYEELSKATNNFSRSEILGSGAFGVVYKGVLPSGALIAVKRRLHESKFGEEGFQAEAASLSQIRHRNLVQLRGWCHEEEELMLVYDFMCNGGLDEWLFRFPERKGKARSLNLGLAESLPLMLRHSILSGVATALAYLHEECNQCVLHRDIKSSNVLLDEDLNAHVGDFGLARLIDHQKMDRTTWTAGTIAGTLGYMAPEMPVTGKATKESDVYSFGVLMLEVMCGMPPLDTSVSATERAVGALVDRVWHALETGNILRLVDPKLGRFPPPDADPYDGMEMQEESGLLISEEMAPDLNPGLVRYTSNAAMEDQKMVTYLLHLGLLCCHPNPEDRPSMRLVSQWLQAPENMEMSLPPLPRCKPQGWYSRPRLSLMAMTRSVQTSSKSDDVEDVGQGSL